MEQLNVKEFLSRYRTSEVIGRYVHLTKRNGEHVGICPFHDDTKASMMVNDKKGIFWCFACGTGGDAIDFLTKQGRNFKEAVNEIAGGTLPENMYKTEKRETKKPEAPEYRQITRVLDDVPAPPTTHGRYGTPSATWKYRNADGSLYGYVYRFNTPDGKEIFPLIYAENANGKEWRFQGFSEPRPLYNLHLLTENPTKTVVVVEGEKCADYAATILPKAVCVAWQGGSNAIHKTDWSPLAGRNVLLFPDNDEPGKLAMFGGWQTLKTGRKYKTGIYQKIKDIAKSVRGVKMPDGVPSHWDIADSGWTAEQAKQYILSNLEDIKDEETEREETVVIEAPKAHEDRLVSDIPLPDTAGQRVGEKQVPQKNTSDAPAEVQVLPDPTSDNSVTENFERGVTRHFVMLGYEKAGSVQEFYFYVRQPKIVLTLSASQITRTSVLTLAPLQWWEENFPAKTSFQLPEVQNWIIQCQNARGQFNPDNVRGRGAWIDKHRTIIHCGDYLLVDGKKHNLGKPTGSQFIYESRNALRFATAKPLEISEAARLMELLELVNWEREVNSYLLAGWCVIAPICGSLTWRPHIWITGSAGTGKSWLFKNIAARLLGNTVLRVQSQTTEAGVRQRLANDALPVIFDEAESENNKDNERMDTILGLVRAASSDDSGEMIKGSANGVANIYTLRSCFAFASIVVQIKMQADRGRISVLGIKKLTDEKLSKLRWQELQKKYAEIFVEEFVERFQARTVALLPIIVKNIGVFSSAIAAELGEQRTGDQLGALLAGAYSLFSDKAISYEDAMEFVRSKDWTEERGLDKTRDEIALIQRLLEQMIRVELDKSSIERSIGELCLAASGEASISYAFSQIDANDRLKRHGFKVEGGYIVISNTAEYIKQILRNTTWSKNHNKILMRLDGAEAVETTRFASGLSTRAVRIPLSIIAV